MENMVSYENDLLKMQISQNSKKIDEYLKELKQVAIKLSNDLVETAVA